ncbi:MULTISPECIES: aspartate-semialdehyde dehydrogenase [Clostridium]|uniref:Aspartate-semialdehyde dehydrogenase n=1 Tax=Clostridium botulinum TaxID=1491 RepID=A0A6B4R2U3_CLOBO|nr:aspartate-semialdehyde dehydrogenase [Clostridium botulinum]ACD52788.1 aspartate-semialdehyde dehydrogenase [Clostridium botulinum E3 str. Alaska E43]AJF30121.1 aspartate-semialdehyde dehydrogenase [Clostridium botulinum]AJF33184.1 aspartate-semialdehyde dehydrogenase [Clostridium botulinum]EES48461.1 aspartate-semialdehyde dehydrogenase [Clostridium botulinum E1 str. 'BoNT E Beluga']MBN1042648.1 aspartate-semialdehyde dehydrogenase [Clostridium botulinum]
MYNVAIVGATGNVGRKFLEILEERDFPVKNLYLFASKRSEGKTLKFKGEDFLVEETCEENIKNKKIDYALFSAGGDASKEFAPIFASYGAVAIDNSSAWRMDPEVPLVVPEVNPEDIKLHKGIIANPNCSTIQAMPIVKALNDKYGIKRIVYSTYQAVSGAGIQAIKDLEDGVKGIAPKKFPYPIAGNVLPHIDVFLDNGYTKEEEKMINETRKILHCPDLRITATTARVPVLNGHSESINVELNSPFEVEDIFELFRNTNGVTVYDDVRELKYPTPLMVSGKDDVYVGRIRRDFSIDNGLNLWVVGDNIRKGAALNAIQIAEIMIQSNN